MTLRGGKPLKISEFAEKNNVTAKMLRHYDEIGLLKPSAIDGETGYRFYEDEQSNYLSWIIILKNLDFSLVKIKEMLNGPMDVKRFIGELINKRIEIYSAMNEQIHKKVEIDRLIKILEKEGFQMDKQINLLDIKKETVHEIKRNIPNMEMFLDEAERIRTSCTPEDMLSVFRFDLWRFKQINDDYGFEIGDNVIVACYNIVKKNVQLYLKESAIGRAGGDEFIVFARAEKVDIEKVAGVIVNELGSYDFSSTGCSKEVGCYIGGLSGKPKTLTEIRKMIEGSIEVSVQARKSGKNSFVIQNV